MKTPYRVALIGTGAIAGDHVAALQAAGSRVELVAAADTDAARVEAFAQKYQVPAWYVDPERLLRDSQPDLVLIATPPAFHADLAIASLQAGAWVLCEKPLCGSLADFDRISEAEAQTGRFVSTIFQWRFGSAVAHLKALMAEGALGKPLISHCLTLWYRDPVYYAVPWRGKWATEIGGPTMGLGIHLTDLLFWLWGDWAEVTAIAATLDRPIEVEDVSMALVRFENGALGSITNTALAPRQETYLRLDYQRVTVEMRGLYAASNANWAFSLPEKADDPDLLMRLTSIPTDIPGKHPAQLLAVLDSMDRGARPPVSGDEGRRILEFSSALYKSATLHQPVSRGSIRAGDPFYAAISGTHHAKG